MEQLPILIASSSSDEHAYGPVRERLEERGFPVVVYKTDCVLRGEENFCLEIDKTGQLEVTYQEAKIGPDDIAAGWYRKVSNFSIADSDKNLAKQLYMNNEIRALHGTIWPLYPNEVWLNSPSRIAESERKLKQLIVAREIGFSILDTLVTNSWNDIDNLRSKTDSEIAMKMIMGIISDGDEIKGFHTTPISEDSIQSLRVNTVPFPGIVQTFADKYREWRVTVVGQDVFSAAIYTEEDAKDDWRKHQTTSSVTFKDERIADEISDMCINYLGEMGLKFGAFDFIERNSGEIVFLECNPNGQYGWLEEDLGFQITNSLANELIKLAKT